MNAPEHLRWPTGCHPLDQYGFWCGEVPAEAQLDVIRAFASLRYVLATFPNSGGKPQPKNLVIPTPDGPRRFGDLRVGDRVFARDGSQTTILAVFDKGVQPVFRLTFDRGEVSTLATGDHQWWYMRPASLKRKIGQKLCSTWKKWVVASTDDIIKEQRGHISKSTLRGYVPACSPVRMDAREFYISPYLMGVLLGDGGLTHGSVMFSTADSELLDRVKAEIPKHYSVKHSSKYDYRISLEVRGSHGRESPLTSDMRRLGLMGLGSYAKFIPDEYKLASVEQRIELLRGLMDTDGCCKKGGKNEGIRPSAEFSTISPRLARDVSDLVRSLGGRSSISSRTTKYTDKHGNRVPGQLSYRVSVRTDFNPFWLARKASRWRTNKRQSDRLVYSVEPAGEADCMCILVDSPDHSYLTNDYIVTHNTSIVLPVCILSAMCAFPGAILVVEGGSEKQLFVQLFNTNLFPLVENLPGWKVWKGDRPRIRAPNGSECEGYVASDELKVEGFHGKWDRHPKTGARYYRPMIYITDESKGISNEKAQGIQRIEPDFWLAVTSPGYDAEHWTYQAMRPNELKTDVQERTRRGLVAKDKYYDPSPVYSFPKEFWKYRRMVMPADLPHLQTKERLEYRENLKKQHGENSQWYRSMALGEFALSTAENNIFLQTHLDLMLAAMTGGAKFVPGDVRASADVSGGGDNQVLGVREGTNVMMLKRLPPMNEPQTARALVEHLRDLAIEPHQFWIDGGGIGSAIGNIMESTLGYVGINRCMANTNPTLSFEYADKYTEIHYWLKELLSYGILKLPHSQDLLDQARDRLYVIRSGSGNKAGRIACQPKEKYRENHSQRSPDELDTLVYLFYDFNMDAIRRGVLTPTARKVEKQVERPAGLEIQATHGIGGFGAFSGLRPAPQFALLRKQFGSPFVKM